MEPINRRPQSDLIIYVPRADRDLPPDQQTIIKLRPMTLAERCAAFDARELYVKNAATGERISRGRDFMAALETCAEHIVEIVNFPSGANGSTRPWPKDGSLQERLEYLAQFPEGVLVDMEQEVFLQSVLPADAKNS